MTRRVIVSMVLTAAALAADVTARYSFEIVPGPMVPPAEADKLRAQLSKVMPAGGITTQLKANRAYTSVMGMNTISDFDGAIITLIDPKNKKFSTLESAAYARSLQESQDQALKGMSPQAKQMMSQVKPVIEVRKTGQTRTINGVRATETQMTMTVEMPGNPVGPIRSVMSFWIPEKEEMMRNPALREMHQFSQRAYLGTNPADMMEKAFAQQPAMGEAMKKIMEDFKESGAMLEMRTATYMPGMAAFMQKMGQQVPAGLADGPMMEIVMSLKELSTAELPVSIFEVPRDYTAVPMAEVLGGVMPKPPAPARQ